MRYNTGALISLLLAVALALVQPHKQHLHLDYHEKRDLVWTTEVEYVTEYVDITTTIWVNGGITSTAATITTFATTTTSSPLTSNTPAEFHQAPTANQIATSPTTLPQPPPPPPPSSTSSAYVAPPPQPPPYVAPPAVPTSAADNPPPTTEVPAPAQSSVAPAQAPASSPPSSGGDGTCSSGSPCTGDLTYYQAGLGACGETTDGDTDYVIALPVGMMGSQSNGNPYCGKMVTITKDGKSVNARVVDKCMGCVGFSIDLSDKTFSDLGIDYSVGRTQGTWYFS